MAQPALLVVSYPRCGYNWLRHCTECITGLRTPGTVGHALGCRPRYAFQHTHQTPSRNDGYTRMLLLLRDYHECWHRRQWRNGSLPFHHYGRHIQRFDRFTGEKRVAYFEDITQGDGILPTLQWMFDDLSLPADWDWEQQRGRSQRWYRAVHGSQDTRLSRPESRAVSRGYLHHQLGPELFAKHLSRYEEQGDDDSQL